MHTWGWTAGEQATMQSQLDGAPLRAGGGLSLGSQGLLALPCLPWLNSGVAALQSLKNSK